MKKAGETSAKIINLLLITLIVVLIAIIVTKDKNSISDKVTDVKQENKTIFGTIIWIDNCTNCTKIEYLLYGFNEYGLNIDVLKNLNYSSEEAKEVLTNKNITILPALILSKSASENQFVIDNWNKIGSVENNGEHVLRVLPPPYYDLNLNRVVGIVTLTNVIDSKCDYCYDVNLHKNALKYVGISPIFEKTIDINEDAGRELVKKYNITKVPTIILDEEARFYPLFIESLTDIGTKEEDGSFIIRRLEDFNLTYKNISLS